MWMRRYYLIKKCVAIVDLSHEEIIIVSNQFQAKKVIESTT